MHWIIKGPIMLLAITFVLLGAALAWSVGEYEG
jgi:hypothetical protein